MTGVKLMMRVPRSAFHTTLALVSGDGQRLCRVHELIGIRWGHLCTTGSGEPVSVSPVSSRGKILCGPSTGARGGQPLNYTEATCAPAAGSRWHTVEHYLTLAG